MNNQFSGSRIERRAVQEQQTQPHIQYVNEYDSYGYLQPPSPHNQLNQSSAVRQGYHINPNGLNNYYVSNAAPTNIGASRVKSESNRLVSSQVKNENIVKGESRVSYVPYEKKVIEYEDRTYVQKVPIKRKVVQYQERRVIQTVPREVIKQDYYAVEKRIQYFKEIVPEKKIEMVAVQRKIKRYEYVPVEKQIVHYPENVDIETAKGQSRVVLRNQGVQVKSDAEFRPINPALLYNYSARPQSKHNPIGYVDQGQSRVFSNSPTYLAPSFHPQQYLNPNQQSEYVYYEQQQPTYTRTQSAQKFETSRVFSPRAQYGQPKNYPQGQSYIRELSNIGKGELKRPFELLQQSSAQNQGGNYSHLQRYTTQRVYESNEHYENTPTNDQPTHFNQLQSQ